jgi:hypothetical protein
MFRLFAPSSVPGEVSHIEVSSNFIQSVHTMAQYAI